MKLRRAAWLSLVLVAGRTGFSAAADQPSTVVSLASPSMFPSLAAFASAHDIPLTGFELAESAATPRPGDRVILLLHLSKAGTTPQQWLVLLDLDELTAKERSSKLPENVIYTTTGLELRYAHSPAVLQVKLIGPFRGQTRTSPAPDPASKEARAVVSREYLTFGVAAYCRSALTITTRLKAAGLESIKYAGKGSPFSADAIIKGKAAAEKIQLTADEERLAYSVFFSLRTFFDAAIKIPALQNVLEQVIVKPSVWSIATNVGLNSNFIYGWHGARLIKDPLTGLNLTMYSLPLQVSLNGTPALTAIIGVVDPQPPLEVCAGILAIDIMHPTDATKRLSIRVLAARHSAAK